MAIEIGTGGKRALRFRVEERLRDCGVDQWEKVTAQSSLFMRAPFLQAFEEGMPATLKPRYGVLSDGDVPVAVLAGQVLTLHADRIPSGSAEKSAPQIVKAAMSRMRTRVFMWGNFMGWGSSGIALAPGADASTLLLRVVEAIDRSDEADDEIRSAGLQLVLDLSPAQTAAARELEKHGFRPIRAEPDMVLALDPAWKALEDYRTALKSKYRKASVEMDAELSRAGCVIEKLVEVDSRADELIALHLQVHEQSINRFVTLRREFIPALARHLAGRFHCRVVRNGSRLLGFITTLIDGDTAIAYVVGHDAEANSRLPVYLRLLQTAIEDGLAHRCKRVTYGRTALEPKARLGALPAPLTVYGRHTNPVLGPLVTRFLQHLAPAENPPARNPFKEQAPS